jgi:hypothetical protein
LRPKLPNRVEKRIHCGSSTILTCVIVVHDCPITKASCASAWHGQHSLLLMCSCWLMSPSVSHHGQSSNHLGPSVQASRPSFTVPNPWHDTSLLDLLYHRRPSLCSTPAHHTSQETCCTWHSR